MHVARTPVLKLKKEGYIARMYLVLDRILRVWGSDFNALFS